MYGPLTAWKYILRCHMLRLPLEVFAQSVAVSALAFIKTPAAVAQPSQAVTLLCFRHLCATIALKDQVNALIAAVPCAQ